MAGESRPSRVADEQRLRQLEEENSRLRRELDALKAAIDRDTARDVSAESVYESSAAQFRALFDEAPVGVVVVDLETGAIIECNELLAEQMGYTRDELKSLTVFEMETSEQGWGFLDRIAQDGASRFEVQVKGKNGEVRDYFVNASKVTWGGRLAAHGVLVDLSENKAVKRQLELTLGHLREAQRITRVGSWEKDVHTGRVYWSEGFYRILGRNPAAGIPTPEEWMAAIHPDDRARVLRAYETEKKTGSYSAEYRIRRFDDGAIRWLHAEGEAIFDDKGNQRIQRGVAQDITSWKEAEEALRESEQRMRVMAEQIPAVLWTLDRDLRFTFSTGSGLRALGLKHNQVVGMSIAEFFQTDDPNFPQVVYHRRALAGESVNFLTEWAGRSYQTYVEPLRMEDGEIVGVIGVAYDVTDQRAAEANLRESEARLRLALEAGSIGTWDWDLIENRVYADARTAELSGLYRSTAAAGLPLEDFASSMHEDDRERVSALIQHAIDTGEPYQAEYRVVTPEGERWVLARGVVERDRNGVPVRFPGALSDITARKHAELELAEQGRLLGLVLETIPLSVYWKDRDLRYQGCNPEFLRRKGLNSPEEVIGKTVFELPDASPRAMEYHETDAEIVRTGQPRIAFEEPYCKNDGRSGVNLASKVPITDGDGKIVGMLGVCVDITEMINARERAEDYARRLELATNSAQLGIWDYDPVNDRAIWDRRMFEIFQVDEATFSGCYDDWARTVVPEDLGPASEKVKKALDSENTLQNLYRIRWPNGEIRWIETYGSVRRDAEGRAIRLIGINRDVTERMLAEDELRKLNIELERRVHERTEEIKKINKELEAFTYTVSHDLRAPLRAMHGMSQALMEDYADILPADGVDFARRIVAAAERMDGLIQDLLAFSRVGRTESRMRSVSLSVAVEGVLQALGPSLEKAGARVEVAGDLPAVIGHPGPLDQVLTNLIDNAAKFVEKGVVPEIRIRWEANGDRIRLWVEDNGIGIEPKYQERIFRIFERLHGIETYPGTGVGLALVKKAMQHMRGDVGLESEPGKGTRFWIELPAAAARET